MGCCRGGSSELGKAGAKALRWRRAWRGASEKEGAWQGQSERSSQRTLLSLMWGLAGQGRGSVACSAWNGGTRKIAVGRTVVLPEICFTITPFPIRRKPWWGQ